MQCLARLVNGQAMLELVGELLGDAGRPVQGEDQLKAAWRRWFPTAPGCTCRSLLSRRRCTSPPCSAWMPQRPQNGCLEFAPHPGSGRQTLPLASDLTIAPDVGEQPAMDRSCLRNRAICCCSIPICRTARQAITLGLPRGAPFISPMPGRPRAITGSSTTRASVGRVPARRGAGAGSKTTAPPAYSTSATRFAERERWRYQRGAGLPTAPLSGQLHVGQRLIQMARPPGKQPLRILQPHRQPGPDLQPG